MMHGMLRFAQFEREVTGEQPPDKTPPQKKKGMWMERVDMCKLGYDASDAPLVINPAEPRTVKAGSSLIYR